MSETFLMGALLAAAGGFLDAYTYLIRGGVFSNAQTGNMVLLGVELAQGAPRAALRHLIPVLAFALGVAAAELIRRKGQTSSLHWRQITVAVEMVLLAVVAFLPQHRNTLANICVSFVCAMQVESFRKVNGNTIATTMCTGNLRSGTELFFRFLVDRDHVAGWVSAQYYGLLLAFAGGAGLGVWFIHFFGERAVLLCCALLAVAFVLMFFPRKAPSDG